MKKNIEKEWQVLFEIAEEDKKAFTTLIQMPDISLSVACFHGQQAVEKYIKAVLSKHAVPFPFTHDLLRLDDMFVESQIAVPVSRDMLKKLNPFAVKQRYDRPPEIHITRQEAQDIVDSVANWCKGQLHD